MLCRSPFVRDKKGEVFTSSKPSDWLKGVPFRCGKCLACRVAKRREWTTRLILEMVNSSAGCFLTLTYDEKFVPWADDSRTLDKRDAQLFMKRLRRNVERNFRSHNRDVPQIRYFLVGEYGKVSTQRPHYHIILFGLSDTDFDVIKAIDDAWRVPSRSDGPGESYGYWELSPLNAKRVAYCAGYVAKKLIQPHKFYKKVTKTVVDSVGRSLNVEKRILDRSKSDRTDSGVLREFRLMSRRPGLGSAHIFNLVALWKSNAAFRREITVNSDVASTLHCFGRTLFLDRFLKSKLREALGIEHNPELYYAEVRQGFFDWLNNPALDHAKQDYVDYLVSQDDQRFKQLLERVKRQLQKRDRL